MKTELALICFTQNGARTAQKLLGALGPDFIAQGYVRSRNAENWGALTGLARCGQDLQQWTGEQFAARDCLIFVGACGIAVRAIAPFVADKLRDPAVVVIDEMGRFCISLLSGHVGRANELAEYFAGLLGAQPVVTTATDLHHLFAVDVFARQNDLVLTDRDKAKAISADILSGKRVLLASEWPIRGKLPEGVTTLSQSGQLRAAVQKTDPNRPDTLWLPPKRLHLGIGCRKGIAQQAIEQLVQQALSQAGLSIQMVKSVASIDLKAKEAGLLDFCRAHELPFATFSAHQLQQAKGDFSPSAFVQSVTGVDNVCERAAVLAAGGGELLLHKQAQNGVTVAAAMEQQIEFTF